MTEITEDRDFKTNINVESQTINYIKNPEKFKEDLQKAKNEIYDIYHAVDSTVNLQGEETRSPIEQVGEVRQAKVIYNLIDSRLQKAENQEDIAKAFEEASEDLGYRVKVIFTDPSNSPQLIGVDKKGNTYIKNGTAYVDEKTGIGYILVNTESPANSTKAGAIGTIAEEQSHVIGKFEGRQKVVPDGSEKGLESLGRPTNDYFKKQYSKNDKAIDLKSDGKDYSNVDFGEHVGDNSLALGVGTIVETGVATGTGIIAGGVSAPVVAGITVVGGIVYYAIMPEEQKEELKREISEIYEDVKKSFGSILDKESSKNLVADVIKFKLKEKGIEADVKIDKDGNIIYTMTPLPKEKRDFKIPPMVPPKQETPKERWEREERFRREQKERDFKIPPMVPPKQETPKERWEREERFRREQKERENERSKPNGIPLQQEKPATIYYVEKTKEEKRVKSKGEILEEIGKADQKLDEQEGIKRKNGNIKKRKIYETKEGYTIYADDFHSKVEYEVFNKKGKHIGTISAKTIIEKGFHKEDIDTSKKDPKKRIDK